MAATWETMDWDLVERELAAFRRWKGFATCQEEAEALLAELYPDWNILSDPEGRALLHTRLARVEDLANAAVMQARRWLETNMPPDQRHMRQTEERILKGGGFMRDDTPEGWKRELLSRQEKWKPSAAATKAELAADFGRALATETRKLAMAAKNRLFLNGWREQVACRVSANPMLNPLKKMHGDCLCLVYLPEQEQICERLLALASDCIREVKRQKLILAREDAPFVLFRIHPVPNFMNRLVKLSQKDMKSGRISIPEAMPEGWTGQPSIPAGAER